MSKEKVTSLSDYVWDTSTYTLLPQKPVLVSADRYQKLLKAEQDLRTLQSNYDILRMLLIAELPKSSQAMKEEFLELKRQNVMLQVFKDSYGKIEATPTIVDSVGKKEKS